MENQTDRRDEATDATPWTWSCPYCRFIVKTTAFEWERRAADHLDTCAANPHVTALTQARQQHAALEERNRILDSRIVAILNALDGDEHDEGLVLAQDRMTEIARLKAAAADFQMAYRLKSDEQTKAALRRAEAAEADWQAAEKALAQLQPDPPAPPQQMETALRTLIQCWRGAQDHARWSEDEGDKALAYGKAECADELEAVLAANPRV